MKKTKSIGKLTLVSAVATALSCSSPHNGMQTEKDPARDRSSTTTAHGRSHSTWVFWGGRSGVPPSSPAGSSGAAGIVGSHPVSGSANPSAGGKSGSSVSRGGFGATGSGHVATS